jgi:hypothetical protein
MQKDLRVKALGPFDHRRVKMRMRNRDGPDAACALPRRLFLVARNAVPTVSAGRLQGNALPDTKFGSVPIPKAGRFISSDCMITSEPI